MAGVFPCLSGHQDTRLTPALPSLCFPSSSAPNRCSALLSPPVRGLFSNSSPDFFNLFFLLFLALPLPPLLPPLPSPLSSVCSRVMVCCGLPTQRNNISGVGKVQPHMSCAAEGRLCEVRPIPHGSYSSQPRDQRPAIPLPSSSSSSSSFSSFSSSYTSSHHH